MHFASPLRYVKVANDPVSLRPCVSALCFRNQFSDDSHFCFNLLDYPENFSYFCTEIAKLKKIMSDDTRERYINPFEQAEIAKYSGTERRQYEESKKVRWDNYSVIKTEELKGMQTEKTETIQRMVLYRRHSRECRLVCCRGYEIDSIVFYVVVTRCQARYYFGLG